MNNVHVIESRMSVLGSTVPEFSDFVVKNEPMLFNCDLEHADLLGGPITKAVLNVLPDDWKRSDLVVDSRVHMLMPGWYPCIPGWHHDDVPRTRADKQPNYGPGQDRSEHLLLLVNGDIAPTAMATGSMLFLEPEAGKTIYAEWDKEVNLAIQNGLLEKSHIPSNLLVHINDRTWHTGTAAVKNGWRFFIRFSRYFDCDGNVIARRNPRTNELRRQVQVYLDNVNAGW